MDRRVMLTSAAFALIAGPTLAQSTASSSTGSAEQEHAMKTAMVGGASLMMADIALEKAHGAKVKEFARFEHDEQTTVAEILKSMDPGMAKPAPDAKTMAVIDKLKEEKAGATFDRTFIQGQIDGHEMLLAIQDDYLKSGKDQATINATKLVRGMVKEHLTLLADLKKSA